MKKVYYMIDGEDNKYPTLRSIRLHLSLMSVCDRRLYDGVLITRHAPTNYVVTHEIIVGNISVSIKPLRKICFL